MESVFLSAIQYLFVRTQKESGAILSEGCVSFVTSQGFFAALGHNEDRDSPPYMDAELVAQHIDSNEPIQAGKVLLSQPSGLYGAFYDDYEPPVFSSLQVASMQDIIVGKSAELWMPIGTSEPRVFRGVVAALFPDKLHPVLFEIIDSLFPGATFGCSGSVIVQDGKIVAVVAGANSNPAKLLYCTAAERMVDDLTQMIHELSISEDTTVPSKDISYSIIS